MKAVVQNIYVGIKLTPISQSHRSCILSACAGVKLIIEFPLTIPHRLLTLGHNSIAYAVIQDLCPVQCNGTTQLRNELIARLNKTFLMTIIHFIETYLCFCKMLRSYCLNKITFKAINLVLL